MRERMRVGYTALYHAEQGIPAGMATLDGERRPVVVFQSGPQEEAFMSHAAFLKYVGSALALWVMCVTPARGQTVDTGVLGAVTDVSGAVIPGATVTVRNRATGVEQQVVSGENGAFEVRYLMPGDYVVDV